MPTIFHITQRHEWLRAVRDGLYRADSLETEGFIHCSTSEQVERVANTFFKGQRNLVLLYINEQQVQTQVRYEAPPEDPSSDQRFPHIYGPLNVGAVERVTSFQPDDDGTFVLSTAE